MTKAYFIVNCRSGTGEVLFDGQIMNTEDVICQKTLQPKMEEFSDGQFNLNFLHFPKDGTTLSELVEEALDDGANLIIGCGGDGTFSVIANVLAKRKVLDKVDLGIISIGTANNLAQNLKIQSNDVWHNVKTILSPSAKIEYSDLGIIKDAENHEYAFVNVATFGPAAQVMEKGANLRVQVENSRLIKRIGWKLFYWVAGLWLLFTKFLFTKTAKKQCPEMKIKISERREVIEKPLIISIGNGASCGGGFNLNPSAQMNDGMLDFCFVKPLNAFQLLFRYLPKARRGTHLNLSGVQHGRSKEIIIGSVDPITANIDGDPLDSSNRFTVSILPRALRVRTL